MSNLFIDEGLIKLWARVIREVTSLGNKIKKIPCDYIKHSRNSHIKKVVQALFSLVEMESTHQSNDKYYFE